MRAGGKTLRHQTVLRLKALVQNEVEFLQCLTIVGSSCLITPSRAAHRLI